jgi:hypothetical protein
MTPPNLPVGSLLLLLMLVTAFPGGSPADEITTSIDVSAASVRVAEPFQVTYRLTAPAGTRVSFPEVVSPFGEFDVISQDDRFDIPLADGFQRRCWTRQLTLECLTTGDLQIPELEIRAESASGSRGVRFPQQTVHVVSVLENQADPLSFRDIQGVVDVPQPQAFPFRWMLVTAVALAAAAVAGLVVFKLATRTAWVSPKQWALQELAGLPVQTGDPVADGQLALATADRVLRTFLETRFDLAAYGRSVAGLQSELGRDPSTAVFADDLGQLLQLAEQSKFAGVNVPDAEVARAVKDTRELIERMDHIEAAFGIGNHNTEAA